MTAPGTVPSLISNDLPNRTVRPSIGVAVSTTDPLAADLFALALRATEAMVRNAAEKSMPKMPRFVPKVELAAWDANELATVAGMFVDAVQAANAQKPRVRRAAA